MKKIISIVLALVTLLTASAAFASDYKIMVNGEEISFDRQPVVENGVVFIPYRFVAEKLGAKVSWHNETKTVFSEYSGAIVTTQIGNALMFVNDATHSLENAPMLVVDRTMVTGDVFEKGMGAKVTVDEEAKTIFIEK